MTKGIIPIYIGGKSYKCLPCGRIGIFFLLMDPKLLREKGCADAISVSVRTLRYWRRHNIIPFLKIGALVMYDLDQVVQALRTYQRPAVVPSSHSRKKAEKIATAKLTEAK